MSPVSAFNVEVLPAPLAPIRVTISPAWTLKSIPLTAAIPPYATARPCTVSRGELRRLSMSRASDKRFPAAGESSNRAAEVSRDDAGVALYCHRRALGDFLAVIEHGNTIAQPHDQLYVVFDQQYRGAVGADAFEQQFQ